MELFFRVRIMVRVRVKVRVRVRVKIINKNKLSRFGMVGGILAWGLVPRVTPVCDGLHRVDNY
jgi:hypothetical protein